MRLDKFLSLRGIATRKESTKILKKGLVTVNGEVVKSPKVKININDEIIYNGMEFLYEEFVYYILNKPAGYVSATKDNLHPTVIELLDDNHYQNDLFPVGRLDIDTTGLLLITNDGNLAHKMLHPKNHVKKTYIAELERPLDAEQIEKLEAGVIINEDYLTKPAQVRQIETVVAEITISEGKFHQVKKMFAAVGNNVVNLERIKFGNLELPEDLEQADYMIVDREQIEI